jgi:hypothetical protein
MSLTSQLHDGELADWCARRMPGTAGAARHVIAEVGQRLVDPLSEADAGRQALADAAFAVRVAALVQPAPPYDALAGLVNAGLVGDRWANEQALLYPSHRSLLIAERGRALDIRPSVAGWLDLDESSPAIRRKDWDYVMGHSGPAQRELPSEPVLGDLFDRIRAYFDAHAPVGQLGTSGVEAGLARLCWLLALFEFAGKDGELGEPVRRMFRPGVPDAERLHALADGSVVGELVALARTLQDSGALRALRRLAGDPAAGEPLGIARPAITGHWAAGNLLIGGPAGSTLVDVKTAAAVRDVERTGRWLWRLLACAWLDQADYYRVRDVGLYFARHGTLLTWSVDTLAGLLLGGGDPDGARSEFLELAGSVMARDGAGPPRRIEHFALGSARRACIIEETVNTPDPEDDEDDWSYLLDEEVSAPRPGWQVVPDGPTCPSLELAELAAVVCERLPEGWTLHCREAPRDEINSHYWEVFKRRRGGHLRYDTHDSGTSPQGLARLLLFIDAEEAHVARRAAGEEPKPQRSPRAFGPELWRTMAGAEWSHWDMWFCVLCVADHGGDWQALDAVTGRRYDTIRGRYQGPNLAHSADLQKRLTAAGLSAAELAAGAAADAKIVAKARTKIIEKIPPRSQMSQAMNDAQERPDPEREWEEGALYGSWEQFPVSPRGPYDKLMAAARFDWHVKRLKYAAGPDQIAPIEKAVELLVREAGDSLQHLLAVRRAALTVFYLAHENYNDSYGEVGDAANNAMRSYSRTDWRHAGISTDVFWRDFFGMFTLLDNFGVAGDFQAEMLGDLGLASDLGAAQEAITQLHAACTRDGLGWKAKTLLEFRRISNQPPGRT